MSVRSVEAQLRDKGIVLTPDQLSRCTINGKPLGAAKLAEGTIAVEAYSNGTLRICVPGTPISKPRMTQRDKWAQRPPVLRYRDWCDRVRAAVRGCVPAAGAVQALNWTAYFEPPASWPKSKRAAVIGMAHRQKPDRDNIDKAILDCLWPGGDSAIAAGTICKRWDWTARLEIEIVL